MSEPRTEPGHDRPRRRARSRARRRLRVLERTLFLVAFVCLGSYGYVALHAQIVQRRAARELADRRARPAALPGDAGDAGAAARRRDGDLFGRLEVPRLGLSVMVLEGDSAAVLRSAAGHVPGTDGPERRDGNVAVAGHRDTFFRPLRAIRPGDEVTLATAGGTFRYAADSIRVVAPADVAVLDRVGRPVLTLVTCYPFGYVGHAPKRFVVQAHRLPPAATP